MQDAVDLAVVGGGAAGLMAAIQAAEALAGASITVLEAFREPGRKVLISGGGRCNVLPLVPAPERFVSESPPRLVRRFLDRWTLEEQRAFFEELLGGRLREERETRKLFPPGNRSKDVRDALLSRAARGGVRVRCGAPVRELGRLSDGRWSAGEVNARAVVLATGGLSVLAGGADARGLDWAVALGHTVRATYAALAPLTASGTPHAALAGVSLPARLEATAGMERAVSSGGFLFTHRGYSGPAALDVSHVVERSGRQARVTVSFASGMDEALRAGTGTVAGFLKRLLPDRLAELLLREAGVEDVPLARLTREARRALVSALEGWELPADGTEGYRTAEVMGGGIALEEVDPGSGASRRHRGLFFAGEILDAFGPIGGFNFQWAWASGRSAGVGAARLILEGGA